MENLGLDVFPRMLHNKKQAGTSRVVYLTPQGKVFNQEIAGELAQEKDLVFLCGHYEGIDERVLEAVATDFLCPRFPVNQPLDAFQRPPFSIVTQKFPERALPFSDQNPCQCRVFS